MLRIACRRASAEVAWSGEQLEDKPRARGRASPLSLRQSLQLSTLLDRDTTAGCLRRARFCPRSTALARRLPRPEPSPLPLREVHCVLAQLPPAEPLPSRGFHLHARTSYATSALGGSWRFSGPCRRVQSSLGTRQVVERLFPLEARQCSIQYLP